MPEFPYFHINEASYFCKALFYIHNTAFTSPCSTQGGKKMSITILSINNKPNISENTPDIITAQVSQRSEITTVPTSYAIGSEIYCVEDSSRWVLSEQSGTKQWMPEIANDNKQDKCTIVENGNSAVNLGAIKNNHEYRCTNTAITAVSLAIDVISSITEELMAIVIYRAHSATPPTVSNLSGYSLAYSGTDVSDGAFVPIDGKTYTMMFVFNGIQVDVHIQGA